MVENANGGLSDENLSNLCRLCLQKDDFIVDIFHRLNPNQKPLPERIYDLYQVKVKESEGLPTNICHRCLYFTEAFSEFRDNVRKCEARLQNRIASLGILGSVNPQYEDEIKTEEISDKVCIGIEDYISLLPDDNSLITVIDPNQEYESSDEDFSLDSDEEYSSIENKISTASAPPPPPSTSAQQQQQQQQQQVQTTSVPSISQTQEIQNVNTTTPAAAATNVKENFELLQDESDVLSFRNVFLCQYCDMAFISQIECAEHESRHDAANPHSCNYCPFRCSNRQTVINHIKELHDHERPYVCVQCDKTFGRRSDLKKHTTVHTGIRPFSCPVCGKNFSRNTNLTKHLRIHTSLRPFVCQKCPRSFTTPEDLRRHERVHNNQKVFNCSQCTLTFTRKEKLLSHEHELEHGRKLLNIHKSGKSKMNSKSMKMQQQQQQQLQIPAKSPQTENMIISLNPYTDMSQANNMKSNQPDPVFKSPMVPNYSPLKSSSIEQSQQQQQQEQNKPPQEKRKRELRRNFICPVCEKAFLRRRELQRHSMVHTGIKPFPCQYCPKRFSRKDKATRHEKSHFENNLSCSQCSLTFATQSALDEHLKVHEISSQNKNTLQSLPSPSSFIPQHLQHTMQNPLLPPPGGMHRPPPYGQSMSGFHPSQHHQQQQQFHHQQQHPMMMMHPQHMQQMPPMYHHHQGFLHPNYRPPQLNFYSEIQPENSEN